MFDIWWKTYKLLKQICIYIYKTDCLYLCTLFTPELLDLSPPNFAQTSPSTQGRFLTQAWPCQPDPQTTGVPQTLKPKWVIGEKPLLYKKCPDGWRKIIKFFPGSARAWLASSKYKTTRGRRGTLTQQSDWRSESRGFDSRPSWQPLTLDATVKKSMLLWKLSGWD